MQIYLLPRELQVEDGRAMVWSTLFQQGYLQPPLPTHFIYRNIYAKWKVTSISQAFISVPSSVLFQGFSLCPDICLVHPLTSSCTRPQMFPPSFSLKKKKEKKFIYLAALGLGYGMQDLIPWPGIEPGPLIWDHAVLATGPPREVPLPPFKMKSQPSLKPCPNFFFSTFFLFLLTTAIKEILPLWSSG